MNKITLNKNCKRILLDLNNNKYPVVALEKDKNDIDILVYEGLVETMSLINNKQGFPVLTTKGSAYISRNPKLKNPSIFDDTKYLITTLLSIAAIIISIIALYKS